MFFFSIEPPFFCFFFIYLLSFHPLKLTAQMAGGKFVFFKRTSNYDGKYTQAIFF